MGMATVANAGATMKPLKLTADQRRRFDEDGFFLVEDLLSSSEINALIAVIDDLYAKYKQERNLGHMIHFSGATLSPSTRSFAT